MTIEFSYSGDISHLTAKKRAALKKELEECTRARNWDYLDLSSKKIELGGSHDDEDEYEDHRDIKYVLDRYDVEWTVGASEVEYEPNWDSMPGEHDWRFDMYGA